MEDDEFVSDAAGQTWDIVIVGAGAAGAVIAARASEDPHRSVLLLDAGPDYALADDLPEDLRNGHDNSYVDHDWGLEYNPVRDRLDRFPRGRVTGGSTAVNTTIALRGTPADYDEWADLGNPAWAWDEVLPAFNRMERDLDFGAQPYHGDAGPISIRRWTQEELVPTQAAFIEAAIEHGFPACDDVNAPDATGVGAMAMNKLGRLRISTALGYLSAARYRDNLTIQSDTLVNRVLVHDGRAIGVETADGDRISARLVVVSSGAIHTPGVLVRSGIGDADELGAGAHETHVTLQDVDQLRNLVEAEPPKCAAKAGVPRVVEVFMSGPTIRVDGSLFDLTDLTHSTIWAHRPELPNDKRLSVHPHASLTVENALSKPDTNCDGNQKGQRQQEQTEQYATENVERTFEPTLIERLLSDQPQVLWCHIREWLHLVYRFQILDVSLHVPHPPLAGVTTSPYVINEVYAWGK